MTDRRRALSQDQISIGRAMLADGKKFTGIAVSLDTSYELIRRALDPSYREMRNQRVRARRAGDNEPQTRAAAIPADVLLDRERRASAPRSTTAILCGDPAPGQSALDKMRGASA